MGVYTERHSFADVLTFSRESAVLAEASGAIQAGENLLQVLRGPFDPEWER